MSAAAVQLIDQNKSFHASAFSRHVIARDASKLEELPVVSVFGSQSSGKSTLLNHLFGTQFEVMLENNRSQTTHGIWAALSSGPDAIILDVEGTDGRERGEDKDFERKAALFSLAVADVLIVNIWENTIGLYTASNIGLLRTVLAVYIDIYKSLKTSKTTILFVVRDYLNTTPTHRLEGVIQEELEKIWNSFEKPHELSKPLTSFFSLEFAFLPHKLFKPVEFSDAIRALRERFLSRQPEGIIRNESRKRVLLSDFSEYASALWDIIVHNKDLELPTQQELLAEHRCEEVIGSIVADFNTALEAYSHGASGDKILKCPAELQPLIGDATDSYRTKLQRYSQNIVESKSDVLLRHLTASLTRVQDLYCHQLRKRAFDLFDHEIARGTQINLVAIDDAKDRARLFHRSSVQDFSRLSKHINGPELQANFEAALEQRAAAVIDEHFSRSLRNSVKQFKADAKEALANAFDCESAESFWEGFESACMQASVQSDGRFRASLSSFAGINAFGAGITELEARHWAATQDILKTELDTSILELRCIKAFEKHFRTDAAGRPRVFTSTTDMDGFYDEALQFLDGLVQAVARFEPSTDFEKAFPGAGRIQILSDKAAQELLGSCKREAGNTFLEAKQARLSVQYSIPPWLIVLLIVLGWNEFIFVISSPLYLTLALVAIAAAIAVHHLRLAGPIMTTFQLIGQMLSAQHEEVTTVVVEDKSKNQ